MEKRCRFDRYEREKTNKKLSLVFFDYYKDLGLEKKSKHKITCRFDCFERENKITNSFYTQR